VIVGVVVMGVVEFAGRVRAIVVVVVVVVKIEESGLIFEDQVGGAVK